jgi:DnaJ-class molecular chaperone
MRYWIDCPDCARTGLTPGSGGDSASCPICAGTGYANQDTRELCHTCGGTGAD